MMLLRYMTRIAGLSILYGWIARKFSEKVLKALNSLGI